MAATGFTPISLYYSTTASATPSAGNLVAGELALNTTDEKLYFKNASGTVKLLASNAATTPVTPGGSNTQVQYNSSGSFAGSSNLTFDGTSLTLGGNPTLSGGTANGVTYLNGSKVLTSGSALTFDGANIIVNATTPAYFTGTSNLAQVSINRSPSTGAIFNASQSAAYLNIDGASGGSSFQFVVASAANTQPSEQMRLTSTGLGIGTSSPSTKLHVAGSSAGVEALFSYSSGTPTIAIGNSATTYNTQIGYNVTSEYGYIQAVAAAGVYDDIAINPNGGNVGIGTSSPLSKLNVAASGGNCLLTWTQTNAGTDLKTGYIQHYAGDFLFGRSTDAGSNTDLMTLTQAGNLGLGVTPSAWGGGQVGLQVKNASLSGYSNSAYVMANTYYDGTSEKYIASSFAGKYAQASGAHIWYTAPSGTAGNAITFTQAMTLDASGNLGVGTTTTTAARLTLASTTLPALTLPNIAEIATVSATAATGTINYDLTTQSVLYYTTNATGNFTMNIRGNSGLSLNSMLSTGQSVTMAFLCTNGSTAYYQSAMTIDGTSVTPKWQGGTAPSTGNASAIDSYVYTIIKTGSATFTVLASQTKFA